jgi:hypothetical protein
MLNKYIKLKQINEEKVNLKFHPEFEILKEKLQDIKNILNPEFDNENMYSLSLNFSIIK